MISLFNILIIKSLMVIFTSQSYILVESFSDSQPNYESSQIKVIQIQQIFPGENDCEYPSYVCSKQQGDIYRDPVTQNLSQGWNTSKLIGMFNSTDDIMLTFNDNKFQTFLDTRSPIQIYGNEMISQLSFYLSLQDSLKKFDNLDIENLFLQYYEQKIFSLGYKCDSLYRNKTEYDNCVKIFGKEKLITDGNFSLYSKNKNIAYSDIRVQFLGSSIKNSKSNRDQNRKVDEYFIEINLVNGDRQYFRGYIPFKEMEWYSQYVIYPNFKNVSQSWGIKNILVESILYCPLECLSYPQNLGYQCQYSLNHSAALCLSCDQYSDDIVKQNNYEWGLCHCYPGYQRVIFYSNDLLSQHKIYYDFVNQTCLKKGTQDNMLLPSKNIQALASHISMSALNYALDYEYFQNSSLKNLIVMVSFDYPRDIQQLPQEIFTPSFNEYVLCLYLRKDNISRQYWENRTSELMYCYGIENLEDRYQKQFFTNNYYYNYSQIHNITYPLIEMIIPNKIFQFQIPTIPDWSINQQKNFGINGFFIVKNRISISLMTSQVLVIFTFTQINIQINTYFKISQKHVRLQQLYRDILKASSF